MSTSKIAKNSLAQAAAMFLLPLTLSAASINVDFNGVRNGNDSKTTPGPTYVGQGAAGGGTVWNGVLADSRVAGSPDNDALFFGATNLLDSLGNPTTLWFTMGPVGAGNQGAVPGSDPTLLDNLLLDWVLVGYFGETTGTANFTIGGLGSVSKVDLYFYHRGDFPGAYVIPDATATPFPGFGVFTAGNVVCFTNVPVVGGQITGQFTEGGTLLGLSSGFTVSRADPGPWLKSTSPAGIGVGKTTPIKIEIWDGYSTQLNPASVQLFLNDQPVTPVTTERIPVDAGYWTVTALPASGYLEGISNVVKVVYGDTATPPVFKTNSFAFVAAVGTEGHRAINLDINGWRGTEPAPVTYVGQGVAGGGTVFNGINADSTAGDDNLTIGGTNLLDSIGDPTTVTFTLTPVAGENMSATASPTPKSNLFADFAAVGFQGQFTGTSDFIISSLGEVPTVDLYFYFREDPLSDGAFAGSTYTIAGADAFPFTAHGIFNDGNTVYIKNVPVVNGQISGVFSGQVGAGGEGSAAGALSGLTIQKPLPQPYVRRALPKGDYVLPDAPLQIDLQDYVTQVNSNSIQVSVNGQTITPAISKPAGSTITTVTYTPPRGWTAEATNTMSITFADNSAPPVAQTNEFSFFVISTLKAARIVNIDINGFGHSTLPLGPTYVGSGAAGGGPAFNGIVAQSRQPGGWDDDALTIGGTNLLDSIGGNTTFAFSLSPVAGGNSGAVGGQTSEKWSALNHDWVIIGYVGGGFNCAPSADFTITGLGAVPTANVYFYCREDPRNSVNGFGMGSYSIPGVVGSTAFGGHGRFNQGNTTYFERVLVTNGTITGRWSNANTLALMTGLTIELPLPHAFMKSYGPQGGGWSPQEQVKIELIDFDPVQVDPQSILLSVNAQQVTPSINKPTGSATTAITYVPAGGWLEGSSNHVKIVFGDTAAPVLLQTNEFSFMVAERRIATNIINVDINGSRNGNGGVPVIGSTYVGQSAPGGGTVWNGVVADSRLSDGQDNDALFFNAANLVDSLGAPTAATFEMGPVAGGNQGAGSVATAPAALFFDWVLVGYFGEMTGTADFTMGGLGTNAVADLYFYHRGDFPGTYVIPGATQALYSGTGTFDAGHVVYFKQVPITAGQITGQLTEGTDTLALLSGFSIVFPAPEIKPPPPLTFTVQGKQLILSWSGTATLQSADFITGTWTDVSGAANPYTATIGPGAKFFRLKN